MQGNMAEKYDSAFTAQVLNFRNDLLVLVLLPVLLAIWFCSYPGSLETKISYAVCAVCCYR